MLLMDKSIRPGDVISVDDTYSWVNSLGGRYVSIVTRDGTEHLIPNENLFTSKVINWTHSDSLTRIKLPVGIHYKRDVRQAIALCLEAIKGLDSVLQNPPHQNVCPAPPQPHTPPRPTALSRFNWTNETASATKRT